ncbi:benzoate/H(+) symporter BenE family transporter [Roseomonas elaeocarpi]|uniref:Benzoate/H(+) symporter BenE family transporter n=1 Tax=Roseomonas elaeocarpi TaxID=907779 RepID=A0ABV6JNL0_9PROT
MRLLLPPQTVFAGLLAAFVGFASSFAVVLRGLLATGASPAEAASGLIALCMAQGLCALWLSARTRMPVSMAWSTPGAALLAASGAVEGGFPAAVGAFLVAGVLVVLAGWWRPLGRAVAAIPPTLANAMLAGVLLNLCLAPVRAVSLSPGPALAIVLTWAVAGRIHRLLAMPAAVAVTMLLVALQPGAAPLASGLPHPVWTWPAFTPAALVGVAVPLFIVTMASQNIPGIAVLSVNGFHPEPGPLFRASGVFSILAAPFGGHAVNLAAITAAICAGPDAHPDLAQRWKAAAVSGGAYVVLGLVAGVVTGFVGAAPLLVEAVAGLALLGALGGALQGAVAIPAEREAALVTFLVTASGLGFGGISGAFWGLLAGGALLAAIRLRARLGR